jgi:hypothetical protein
MEVDATQEFTNIEPPQHLPEISEHVDETSTSQGAVFVSCPPPFTHIETVRGQPRYPLVLVTVSGTSPSKFTFDGQGKTRGYILVVL